MAKKISWLDQQVEPIFKDTQLQKRFDEFLRSKHSARAALAKLQKKENDPDTLAFLLLRCAGQQIHEGPKLERPMLTERDIQQIKEKASWLADKVAEIYQGYILDEVDTDPLLRFLEITRAPESALKAARGFFQLPVILETLAAAIEPWYQVVGEHQPLKPVVREFWKTLLYVYARTVAKLKYNEVAALINAVEFALTAQGASEQSLKTQINRFKASNRQLYQNLEKSVRLYLELPTPRKPYIQAAGLVRRGLPILKIAALVNTKRRQTGKGNNSSSPKI